MMADICSRHAEHDELQPARGLDGATYCVVCFPRLEEGAPGLYWDYAADGSRTSFDDATATATVHPVDGAAYTRPYTGTDETRAAVRADDAAVSEAQGAYTRAVGLNAAPDQLAALQAATLAAEGIEQGDPWRQPSGAHDAYPLGAIVTHDGQTWESTVAANVWEPGVSSWAVSGGGIPDWVQPSGATDAYPLGAVVRHNALVWRSDLDANVWEPGVYGWTEIPDPEGGS